MRDIHSKDIAVSNLKSKKIEYQQKLQDIDGKADQHTENEFNNFI